MVRPRSSFEVSAVPDLTPMMDLTFNIISFFVMINTFTHDETAQRVELPTSATSAIIEEVRIPDSLVLNIDGKGRLYAWGLVLKLGDEKDFATFRRQIKGESQLQQERQKAKPKDEGLSTTIVLRMDRDADYGEFRKVIDVCREVGFKRFQLKAHEPERKPGR